MLCDDENAEGENCERAYHAHCLPEVAGQEPLTFEELRCQEGPWYCPIHSTPAATKIREVISVVKDAMATGERRTVSQWKICIRAAINAKEGYREQLLDLGILGADWDELGVEAKLDKGEWIVLNLSCGESGLNGSHFVLMGPKPRNKDGGPRKQPYFVYDGPGDGRCLFSVALAILQKYKDVWQMEGDDTTEGIREKKERESKSQRMPVLQEHLWH